MDNGWLVWLRRVDNSVAFNRTWEEYKTQFGDKSGNFWLGLEELHQISSLWKHLTFRAELKYWNGEQAWAEYKTFYVHDENSGFRLSIGGYEDKSTAANSMMENDALRFSTYDRDRDYAKPISCSIRKSASGELIVVDKIPAIFSLRSQVTILSV